MKDFEIVMTYLNGCAGEAYPITSIEEVEIESPEAYLRAKHGKDFSKFVRDGEKYRLNAGPVTYIYEFNEI